VPCLELSCFRHWSAPFAYLMSNNQMWDSTFNE
jgi:hypothetical protein